MAYMAIHQLDGDPDDLWQKKTTTFDPVVDALAPRYGALASVTARTDRGLRIVNVWRAAEDVQWFMQVSEVIAAQKASGLPLLSSFEQFVAAGVKFY